jgi:NAD(P)-dependent dehydrogenase (short-subunit alcohol dehydrogenase family)
MRTWFITGTSSGIGRDLTERLLERGDRVAATLRDVGRLDDLKTRYRELWTARLDVVDGDAVRRAMREAFASLGRIDVIVSNAGYGLFGAAEETSDAQIVRQIETNLLGSMHVIRAAIPHLRRQGGGRIVQISSEGGQTTYPGFSAYHASKWGIEGFVESVAQEVAPFGIACTLIEFGPTATNFGAALTRADAIAAYDATPVGALRRAFESGTSFTERGDPGDVVRAIIAASEVEPALLRRVVGSYAFERIRATLEQRLASIETQKAAVES